MSIHIVRIRLPVAAVILTTWGTIAAADGDALDQQVIALFKQKCTICHDQRPGDAGGDVQNLLDLKAISEASNGYIDPKKTSESYLATIIRDGNMPLGEWKAGVKGNGPLTLRVIVTRDKPLKMKFGEELQKGMREKGMAELGFVAAKGIGIRPGNAPAPNPARPAVPNDLSERPLAEMFAPNDWATAEWTFFTKSAR